MRMTCEELESCCYHRQEDRVADHAPNRQEAGDQPGPEQQRTQEYAPDSERRLADLVGHGVRLGQERPEGCCPARARPSGVLAQGTNIGLVETNSVTVMPELGIKLGFFLNRRMKLSAGYNFIYWSKVARPGDQIDIDVNSSQIPPATLSGAAFPVGQQGVHRLLADLVENLPPSVQGAKRLEEVAAAAPRMYSSFSYSLVPRMMPFCATSLTTWLTSFSGNGMLVISPVP